MKTAVEGRLSMATNDLCILLASYVSENKHSNDVDSRYLASFIETAILPTAREVRNSRIGPELRDKVNAFRAKEIEKEMDDKRREMEILERDLKKLTETKAER